MRTYYKPALLVLVCNEDAPAGVCNARNNTSKKHASILANAANSLYFRYMSGDRYHIDDQHATYHLTCTVVDWSDVFTRVDYKYIITDSLNFCIRERGLECFAWVIMSNHIHLIARTNPPFEMSDFLRDFKKFISKKIVRTIQEIPESRKEWMLHKFEYAAHSTGRAENFKLWQDSNHPICLDTIEKYRQRLNYVHMNPVRQMLVALPEDYIFSSAGDYAGRRGIVNVTVSY